MVTPPILSKLYGAIESIIRNSQLIAGKSGRHMKFPYTITAKMAQFPFFYYCKNNPIWMYWPLGWIVSFYVFRKIHVAANSEKNVMAWAEVQAKIAAKEAEEHH